MSLNDKVVEVALRNLRVMGCKFIVVKSDGEVIVEGDLELATERQKRPYKKVNSFKETGYIDIIGAMQPGDSYEFKCEGDYSPEAFQKVISARAGIVFGRGNHKTEATSDGVALVCLGTR